MYDIIKQNAKLESQPRRTESLAKKSVWQMPIIFCMATSLEAATKGITNVHKDTSWSKSWANLSNEYYQP